MHLALGAAQTGFAFFPTLGKIALVTMPPLPLAALRVTAAALMLELIRRISRAETLSPGDRRRVLLYGAPPILLFTAPALLRFTPDSVSPRSWASFAGVVVLCTVVPYVLNSWALARTGSSKVAVYVFLQPLIATALAVAILRERLTARKVLAGVLILAGLAVSLARPRLPAEEVA